MHDELDQHDDSPIPGDEEALESWEREFASDAGTCDEPYLGHSLLRPSYCMRPNS